MKTLIRYCGLILPLLALCLAGCSEQEVGQTEQESPHPEETTEAVKIILDANLEFMVDHDRLPSDLQELVDKGYLPEIPEPAPGQKIIYDPEWGGAVQIE